MSWNDSLISRARKTAHRRKRIYGIEPSPVIAGLLTEGGTPLNFRGSCRLFIYVYLRSPRQRLILFWRRITDRDTPLRRQHIDSLAADLRSGLSEQARIAANFFERRNYSRDLARVPPFMETLLFRTTPSLVVQPQDERDILTVLSYCKSRRLTVFPRGSGSFAFGGTVPTRNGIVLDLSPLMDILEIDPERMIVRAQPGVRWADLATKLASHGLIPTTTPTSRFSTIGGWVSTGGMGLDSYGFGSVYESVLGVRVARPGGTVEELDFRNESIKDLFGTEGQFGILTEITLRVRPRPEYSGTCLLIFDAPELATEFIGQLNKSGHNPSHVVFYDREFMRRENILFREQTGLQESIVAERDTVLLHFETRENERKFVSWLNGKAAQADENRIAARYLWSDRHFPLKAQRIGPGLLGSEVVISEAEVARYIAKVKKLARRFHIDPAVEAIVCRDGTSFTYLVIVSFTCDYSRSVHYSLSLLFIQLLVSLAVRHGGQPYGIGIWNTPFVKSKYTPDETARLREKKRELDPEETLNPHKYFRVRGRFHNVTGFFLQPMIFQALLAIAHFFSPGLGIAARLLEPAKLDRWEVPAPDEERGKRLLQQSALRCTSCGACISVCPAYHITQDELVAGRTKLRMAEAMMSGVGLEQAEAHSPFQCLHCGLCEEVCQTHLPLRECYLVLERWIEERFGPPVEIVQKFVEKLDSNRDYIKNIFGLDLPDWSPEDKFSRVPAVERPAKAGKS